MSLQDLAVSYDEKQAADAFENATSGEGKKSAPYHKIRKGSNFFIWMPRLSGKGPCPWRRPLVHYNPGQRPHICLRNDTLDNPSDPSKPKEDKSFAKCPVCQAAFDAWNAAGQPSSRKPGNSGLGNRDPEYDAFRASMPSEQGMIVVMNVTSFFNGGDSVDKKLVAAHMESFLQAIDLATRGETVPSELLEGMPEDMAYDAQCGIAPMLTNKTTLLACAEAFRLRVEDEDGEDPLVSPEKWTLCIDKVPDPSKSIPGSTAKVYSYSAALKKKKIFDANKAQTAALMEVLVPLLTEKKVVDIHSLDEGEYNGIDDKLAAHARLNPDELHEYLESIGWTPGAKAPEAPADEPDEDDIPDFKPGAYDPNALSNPELLTNPIGGGGNQLDALKAKLNMRVATDLLDDEDED